MRQNARRYRKMNTNKQILKQLLYLKVMIAILGITITALIIDIIMLLVLGISWLALIIIGSITLVLWKYIYKFNKITKEKLKEIK